MRVDQISYGAVRTEFNDEFTLESLCVVARVETDPLGNRQFCDSLPSPPLISSQSFHSSIIKSGA